MGLRIPSGTAPKISSVVFPGIFLKSFNWLISEDFLEAHSRCFVEIRPKMMSSGILPAEMALLGFHNEFFQELQELFLPIISFTNSFDNLQLIFSRISIDFYRSFTQSFPLISSRIFQKFRHGFRKKFFLWFLHSFLQGLLQAWFI